MTTEKRIAFLIAIISLFTALMLMELRITEIETKMKVYQGFIER